MRLITLILIALQTLGVVAAAVASVIEIESILYSGPILSLTGILIALLSFRAGHSTGFLCGLATLSMAVLCFCTIFGLQWGPSDARIPIAALIVVFSLIFLPLGAYAIRESMSDSAGHRIHFQFSIASMVAVHSVRGGGCVQRAMGRINPAGVR